MNRALDLVLPGLRLAARNRGRGLTALGAWLAMWAVLVFRWERIAATLGGGSFGEWLALVTLLAVAGLAWRLGRLRPVDQETDASTITQWSETWDRFARHRPAVLGLGLVSGLALTALLTPYLAPYDPAAQGADLVASRFQGPSLEHWMGTDRFGRDVLSRVLYGGRTSLAIGGLAVLIAITIGSLVGAVAGYARGWVDVVAMRGVDLLLSFPRLVLLIAIVALVDQSIAVTALVLGLTGWMATSRLVRGEVLSLREREFVQAARALGFGAPRILFKHILPNVASPIIVAATLGIGNTILIEASLSFLGLGVRPPNPSWGSMIARGQDAMIQAPWVALFPGLAIVLTVMSFNLIGDGLRDALDPRARDRRVEPPSAAGGA